MWYNINYEPTNPLPILQINMINNILGASELNLILRLLLAAVFGWLIGLERETLGKTAGTRTFALVALGSALFALASDGGVQPVAAGIGFLGAGLIIFREGRVEGLTTAAALWAAAGMGFIIGQGQFMLCTVATVIMLLVLYMMRVFNPEQWGRKK